MAPDNQPSPHTEESAQESSAEKAMPRFMLAIQRYAQFLHTKAEELADLDDDTRSRLINETMVACDGISKAAQGIDFAITTPSLQDTPAATAATQELATKLAQPDVPAEVRDIYERLYGEDLRKLTA